MIQKESKHYIFNYHKNSFAEKDIDYICDYQEKCFEHICNVLQTTPPVKIEYFLCETAEEISELLDTIPTNGMACFPNTIYAVYNEKVQCIGFHEDAHIISGFINVPNDSAIVEGLAMYFDRQWWGINNWDWTFYYIQQGKYISVARLFNKSTFRNIDCTISYPILGTFVDWLISTFGIDKFIQLYKNEEIPSSTQKVYGFTLDELDEMFVEYVKMFNLDEAIKNRIDHLLEETESL